MNETLIIIAVLVSASPLWMLVYLVREYIKTRKPRDKKPRKW